MTESQTVIIASLIVVATGAFWGVYWLPVRRMAEAGLPGAWGTLAAVALAALVLAPAAARHRREIAEAHPLALASIALGGAAFVLYSVALLYGRVAVIILLFYLTPVWSTLIGRYVMGWRSRPERTLAIALGLGGLGLMLGADGEVPLPRGLGEWLALLSGLLWSVSSTGIRSKSTLGSATAGFVFVLGACAGALVLVLVLGPWAPEVTPDERGAATNWVLAAGGIWWGLSMAALMWAAARLEPARVGLLLMSEVLVGALSGAVLAGERLGPLEVVGGALVLGAGGVEIWSGRSRGRRRHTA
ncbi:DMT family transporter [Tranquillimonas alkanivorans]|uniref:EamA domain-containing membrane protein RarD n=1 Tax=Tranquillimonas alkanivorans TaxID=441119 RepID=A0A1I5V7J5_9RHOB|nr:DMT family transporter [Tranquillimonas alkanivorans]SFQ03327.1 EamA domain-containing membrane protein RarD [Tranquillimonas alkanivorans]